LPQRSSPGIHEPPEILAGPAEFPRDEERESVHGRVEPDGTPVERVVVELAERESVRNAIRSPGGMPFDVGGVESQQIATIRELRPNGRGFESISGNPLRSERVPGEIRV